jgi:hypothetical protein
MVPLATTEEEEVVVRFGARLDVTTTKSTDPRRTPNSQLVGGENGGASRSTIRNRCA